MRTLSVDIESFSSVDLGACGLHKYMESPDFEILLIGYSFDGGPVQVHDCTKPGCWPRDLLDALTDPNVLKTAFNAAFERTAFATALEEEMPPEQWSDTMIMALEMGLPGSLAAAGAALGLPEDQLKDPIGKSLIQYFSKPCRATKSNGGRRRNLPEHDPEKWKLYIEYNRQDVVTEMAIRKKLLPLAESEQRLWCLDQRMNDHGVRIDVPMVEKIVAFDEKRRQELREEARELSGLDNPNSLAQLKGWLAKEGVSVETLRKDDLAALLSRKDLPEKVRRVLEIRRALGKTSTAKYGTMLGAVCSDERIKGILQFYGANRTGRYAGRLVQIQNLARNSLPDLDLARNLTKQGDFETLETLFGETAFVFSELVRTAFIPSEGCRFCVSDFSAIEARVVAWLAGEDWVLDAFRAGKDIYCETASMMYHVPVVKHGVNGELRQKGKIATLACGYGGGVGAMHAMDSSGAIPEDELQENVDRWRQANPKICKLWKRCEAAARTAIEEHRRVRVSKAIAYRFQGGHLFAELPSGRSICYWHARVNAEGQLVYMGVNQTTKQWQETETWGGKLVENCLAGDTLVLTGRGWTQLRGVHEDDELWDGFEWVHHEGLRFKGFQRVISVDGVEMTPDHRVLTRGGWTNAASCEGFNRIPVWVPDSDKLRGIRREEEFMERPVRLRKDDCNARDGADQRKVQVLRVPAESADRGEESPAWDVEAADLERVALDEAAVREPESSGLEELRRPWNHRLQKMVGELRKLFGRHGRRLSGRADARPDRRERQLRAEQLPMDHDERASAEQEAQPHYQHALGRDDSGRGLRALRDRSDDAALSSGSQCSGRFTVHDAGHEKPVYDLLNAGPRKRFTVLSEAGPMIVHNCTQAVARDCLAEAMTRVDAMGYTIVMHVHDEMIVDVPVRHETAGHALDLINKAMSDPISWAPGLPLKGDGYCCDYYMKD